MHWDVSSIPEFSKENAPQEAEPFGARIESDNLFLEYRGVLEGSRCEYQFPLSAERR